MEIKKCCKTCKWQMREKTYFGDVECFNSESKFFAMWAPDFQTCDKWEESSDKK